MLMDPERLLEEIRGLMPQATSAQLFRMAMLVSERLGSPQSDSIYYDRSSAPSTAPSSHATAIAYSASNSPCAAPDGRECGWDDQAATDDCQALVTALQLQLTLQEDQYAAIAEDL